MRNMKCSSLRAGQTLPISLDSLESLTSSVHIVTQALYQSCRHHLLSINNIDGRYFAAGGICSALSHGATTPLGNYSKKKYILSSIHIQYI
jgi:hypothetical protein